MAHKLMRRNEAAAYLGLPGRTLYAMVRAGSLPAVRLGREWRFDRGDLDRWRQRQQANALAPEPPPISEPPDGTDEILGQVLAELREVHRAVVRLSNRVGGR